MKAAIVWEILAACIFAVLIIAALIILKPGTWLWYTVLWLLGALLVLTAFLYIPLAYLSVGYSINARTIVYKKGVFFPSTQVMYRDRIAFVSVYKNPLTPLLHVSSLVISAAGGNIRILFMNSRRADEIAKLLSRGLKQ